MSGCYSLSQAEVLITTPFHPAYLTREIIEKAGLNPILMIVISTNLD